MTDLDLSDLRAKAEAATPGPWEFSPDDGSALDADAVVVLDEAGDEALIVTTWIEAKDAEFIAAANPAVVLELLDRLERAERAIEEGKRIWQSGSHASMEAGLNVYLTLAGCGAVTGVSEQ